MNYDEIQERLKEIKIEDFIWIIYIGIIFFSWYSNSLERNFFKYNNLKSKEKYREITIIIFTILVIVYYYFLTDSIDSIKKLKETDSDKKKLLVYLSFIASLLIFVSGIILLFIAISDEDVDVEIAFN